MRWTSDLDALVRLHYRRRSTRWLAHQIGRSEKAVRHRAEQLGVSVTRKRWSPEHDRELVAMAATRSLSWLAARFKRTLGAVRKRLVLLGVGVEERRSTLSPRQVAELLHQDVTQVRRWIRSGMLKRVGPAAPEYQVRPKDLREFLLERPWAINVRDTGRIEPEVVQLLGGMW